MKKAKAPYLLALAAAMALTIPCAVTLTSCDDDDNKSAWEQYADWREENQQWVTQQAALRDPSGNLLFTAYTPTWAPSSTVYIRFLNDTTQTRDNLRPYYTSTTTVNYTVHLYNGTRVDSAANYTGSLNNQGLIDGWSMAITQMHVGDSIEAIMPYNIAYGVSGMGNDVPPFSALRFNIRLTDIPGYVVRP